MNKQIIIEQLAALAETYKLDLDNDTLERIVMLSAFRGMARCYYIDGDGNDITRGFSVKGTLCMDDGMFGYPESLTEWETLTDTTLMIFKVGEIKTLINENEALKNTYIQLLENALKYKIYRENGFLVENASERYIHFRKMFPEICQTVKQQYIATYLGIAPESLSRIKKSLKEG